MSNFDIVKIYDELSALDANIADTKQQRDQLVKSVRDYYGDDLGAKLKAKPEPFGKVSLEEHGIEVSLTIPKKVIWDQDKLAEIYRLIKESGDDPAEYIEVTYSVKESAYKNLTEKRKTVIDQARTVKDGTPKIDIKQK